MVRANSSRAQTGEMEQTGTERMSPQQAQSHVQPSVVSKGPRRPLDSVRDWSPPRARSNAPDKQMAWWPATAAADCMRSLSQEKHWRCCESINVGGRCHAAACVVRTGRSVNRLQLTDAWFIDPCPSPAHHHITLLCNGTAASFTKHCCTRMPSAVSSVRQLPRPSLSAQQE